MSLTQLRVHVQNYVAIALILGIGWFLSHTYGTLLLTDVLESAHEAELLLVFFDVVVVFALGFIVAELAKPTVIPSFVLAIFFGMACREMFAPVVDHPHVLSLLTTVGAMLILFGGGLDTPFTKFRQLIGPIMSIALIGTLIHALLTSLALPWLGGVTGTVVPLTAATLLGAALASTDPAAIIPSLKSLFFINPRVKHIAVSESAINDVMGAVLTSVFLTVLASGVTPTTVTDAYGLLLEPKNALLILKVLAIGAGVGVLGFAILSFWSKWKEREQTEGEADAAMFLAVPFGTFTLATLLGGSGFLAVFLSSLMFSVRSHFRHIEHYFNHTIEGFMKPMIFMLLGALVNPQDLINYAGLGILTGIVFMLIRPLAVVVTLFPFLFGKDRMSMRELAFLSFVRETGVIPAVLLMSIRVAGVPGSDLIVAVGLWVILLTLIIQPPLTPMVAKALGLARDPLPTAKRNFKGPVAVLCSRGFSFVARLPVVADWCVNHGVEQVVLLHCPEEKFSDESVADARVRALREFSALSTTLAAEGKPELQFTFIGNRGLLQDNIESLIDEGDVAIVFVGQKMLDYRLEDVKRLGVPFCFIP